MLLEIQSHHLCQRVLLWLVVCTLRGGRKYPLEVLYTIICFYPDYLEIQSHHLCQRVLWWLVACSLGQRREGLPWIHIRQQVSTCAPALTNPFIHSRCFILIIICTSIALQNIQWLCNDWCQSQGKEKITRCEWILWLFLKCVIFYVRWFGFYNNALACSGTIQLAAEQKSREREKVVEVHLAIYTNISHLISSELIHSCTCIALY